MPGPWEDFRSSDGPWNDFKGSAVEDSPVPNPLRANPKKYTPAGLQELEPNFLTSPTGLLRTGLRDIESGVAAMAQPNREDKYRGANEILTGAAGVAAPFAIGAGLPALITSPLATLGGLVRGGIRAYAGSKAGKYGTALAGGGEEAQNLGETGGAVLGVGLTPSARQTLRGTVAKASPGTEETLGTLGEYFKGKRWHEAQARYRAGKGGAAPPEPPSAAATSPVVPTTPPSGIDPEAWEQLPQSVRDAISERAAYRAAGAGGFTPPPGQQPKTSPEGGGPVPPPPGHVPEHRREHYTKQAEVGHSEALAKDTKIANFLKGQGKTSADVLKMTDAELADVQRKLGYRPQSGSRSRSMDEFRKHVAAEMGITPPPK